MLCLFTLRMFFVLKKCNLMNHRRRHFRSRATDRNVKITVVKSKHHIAKAAFRLWVNCKRSKTGGIYRNMAKTKKISNTHCGNAAKMLNNIRSMT